MFGGIHYLKFNLNLYSSKYVSMKYIHDDLYHVVVYFVGFCLMT
jgi:hypothetical protein